MSPASTSHEGGDERLCFWPLHRLSNALRHGDVSSREAVQACRDQVHAHDARLNAFITTQWESAAAASSGTRERTRDAGPLDGVPYSLKDNIDVRGWATTCHSSFRRDAVAREHSDVAQALHAAGAVLVGKNALHELATGGPSLDLPWPPARNPWRTDLHPGGSSSGSGVAVASGMAYFSLGTDTGGSVRHPASACGLYGFKPSYGQVSMKGVVPLSASCDHVGTLTRSARDIPLVMDAILTERDQAADYRRLMATAHHVSLKGRVVGVIDTFSDDPGGVDPAFLGALDAFIEDLVRAGAVVRRVAAPQLARFSACARTIVYGEAFAYYGSELDKVPSSFGQRTRERIGQGRGVSAREYILARHEQQQLTHSLNAALADVDVALSLSSFEFPCRIDEPDRIKTSYDRQARVPFSLTGLPSASIPVGLGENGLPIGLSLSASFGHDVELVSALIAIENEGLSTYRVPSAVR